MRFTLEFASESHEELGLVWLKASFSSVQAKDVVLVMVFLVLDVVLLFVLVHTFFSYAPANPVLISNGRGWLLHKKSSISLARHEGTFFVYILKFCVLDIGTIGLGDTL